MMRWMICSTGASSSGCTANKLRSGIGIPQHPLSHRHARDDAIHQIRGSLRHAPAARGANAARLAAKRT